MPTLCDLAGCDGEHAQAPERPRPEDDRQASEPPDFVEIGAEIGMLVENKNKAYGDSFAKSGDILRILYPTGIGPEQYDDALAVARILDKLFRIATDRDALGESPYRDIAGYGILGASKSRSQEQQDD